MGGTDEVVGARPGRVHFEGAGYHVYNRLARGEQAFGEETEAQWFRSLLMEVSQRDGLTVFAWCLMPNHYHLAVLAGAVSLDRPMRSLQQRVTRRVNARQKVFGRTRRAARPAYVNRLKGAGEERYRLRVCDRAREMRKSPDAISRALARGIRGRGSDSELRRAMDRLDRRIAEAAGERCSYKVGSA